MDFFCNLIFHPHRSLGEVEVAAFISNFLEAQRRRGKKMKGKVAEVRLRLWATGLGLRSNRAGTVTFTSPVNVVRYLQRGLVWVFHTVLFHSQAVFLLPEPPREYKERGAFFDAAVETWTSLAPSIHDCDRWFDWNRYFLGKWNGDSNSGSWWGIGRLSSDWFDGLFFDEQLG